MTEATEASEKTARGGKAARSCALVVVAAFFWGTIGLFVTMLTGRGAGTMEIVFYRAAVTMVALALVMLVKDRRLFRIRPRDWWIFLGQGAIGFTADAFCYQTAIGRTSPAVAAALLYTAPAFVALLSPILFHERLTVRSGVSVAVTMLGVFLVSGASSGKTGGAGGILIGVLAGLSYAFYSIFGHISVTRGYSALTSTFYSFVFATAATLPMLDYRALAAHAAQPKMLGLLLVAGLVTATVPFFLYTKGMEGIPVTTASILATLEPVVAALLAFFVLSEPLGFSKIAGIALILAAAVASAGPGRARGGHPSPKRKTGT